MKNRFGFNSRKFLAALIVSSSLTLTSVAQAQIAEQTGTADPGRADRSFSERELTPSSGPKIRVENAAIINAPQGAENIRFQLNDVVVSDSNLYTKEQLTRLYGDMIGTEISLADLYAIANRVTLKYRDDGYILTQVVVPPQTIDGGVARLQVVEGFINNISLQGDAESSRELDLIEAYASQINEGSALNLKDMERQLLLINDLPGVSARSVISPSATTPGAADMLIIVERDPFEASIGADNFGSRFLGPFQFNAAAVTNSLFDLNERISVQTVIAPDEGIELGFGAISYEQPVGHHGTTVTFAGSITDTDPGFTLDQFDVEGISRTLSVTAEHPIIRSRDTNLFGRIGIDWRNVESTNNVSAAVKDKIRALRAGMRLDFLDRFIGAAAVNTIDVEASRGLDIGGASERGDANLTRALGDPQFTKFNLRLQRLQRVTPSINILLSGRGQVSQDPLLSSEEFGLGGTSTVRGYEPSETVGDDGIAGTVEVQWNNPTRQVQLYTFLDSGTVWNQDANNSNQKRNSLSSAGVGVRVDLPYDINAELIAAQPLHRDVESRGNRDPQFFFSLNKEF